MRSDQGIFRRSIDCIVQNMSCTHRKPHALRRVREIEPECGRTCSGMVAVATTVTVLEGVLVLWSYGVEYGLSDTRLGCLRQIVHR